MFPSRFPFKGVPGRGAEAQFYRACETQLDDTWLALYNVYWSGPTEKRNEDSDADFVLLHPEHGIFVVEVKGGEEIFVEENRWYSVPHGKKVPKAIKNPFTQSSQAKRFLWDYIRKRVPKALIDGPFGHFVVFPGHKQEGDLSPQARRELIIDREDLHDLQGSISRIGKYFNQAHKLDDASIHEIKNLLVPSFEIIGSRNSEIQEAADHVKFLTEVQVRTFGMLQDSSRLEVIGGAGTGKTILAIHRAKELSNRGFRVLFLTGVVGGKSQDIYSDLVENFSNVEVINSNDFQWDIVKRWEELRIDQLEKAGYTREQIRISDEVAMLPESDSVQFSSLKIPEPDNNFEEVATEVAVAFSDDSSLFYDALIVDESQLVPLSHYEGCVMFLSSNSPEYFFGDPNQLPSPVFVYDSVLSSVPCGQRVELNVNCRSTVEIASFANRILGIETDEFGVSAEPVRAFFPESEGLAQSVRSIIENWHQSFGLDFDDIHIIWVGDFSHFAPFKEEFWEFGEFLVELPDGPPDWERSVQDYEYDVSKKKHYLNSYVQGSIHYEALIDFIDSEKLNWKSFTDPMSQHNQVQGIRERGPHVFRAELGELVTGLEYPAVIVIDTGGAFLTKRVQQETYVACSRAQFLLAYVGHPSAPFFRVRWSCRQCGKANTYTSLHEESMRVKCSSCELVQDVVPSEDADDIQACWEL